MKEHSHAVNAAVSGLSALPDTGQSFAATRAMTRFLNHPDISFHTLIEPAQDAVRQALESSASPAALVVHDWCMFGFGNHTSKKDRIQHSHDADVGYELGQKVPDKRFTYIDVGGIDSDKGRISDRVERRRSVQGQNEKSGRSTSRSALPPTSDMALHRTN